MAHTCGCGAGCKANASSITADRTVEDVSHESPGALAILKAKGINHCCGAHLTLREAAAAVGTPLDDLLGALAILEGNPA